MVETGAEKRDAPTNPNLQHHGNDPQWGSDPPDPWNDLCARLGINGDTQDEFSCVGMKDLIELVESLDHGDDMIKKSMVDRMLKHAHPQRPADAVVWYTSQRSLAKRMLPGKWYSDTTFFKIGAFVQLQMDVWRNSVVDTEQEIAKKVIATVSRFALELVEGGVSQIVASRHNANNSSLGDEVPPVLPVALSTMNTRQFVTLHLYKDIMFVVRQMRLIRLMHTSENFVQNGTNLLACDEHWKKHLSLLDRQ